MKLLREVKRTLAARTIVHVRVSLAPRDVGDLGDYGLEFALNIVSEVERHRIELVPEIPGMRQQVHVGNIRKTKDSVNSIADLVTNRTMLIESKITLVPAGQILLVGGPEL